MYKKLQITSEFKSKENSYFDKLIIEEKSFKYVRNYLKKSGEDYEFSADIDFEDDNFDFEKIMKSLHNSLNDEYRDTKNLKLSVSITFFDESAFPIDNFNLKGSFIDNHLWQLNDFIYLIEEASKIKFGEYVRKFPQNEEDEKMYLESIQNYNIIRK